MGLEAKFFFTKLTLFLMISLSKVENKTAYDGWLNYVIERERERK